MRTLRTISIFLIGCLLSCSAHAESLEGGVPTPTGYERRSAPPQSFAAYLRRAPLHPPAHRVRLHNGRLKERQDVHHRVLRFDVGARDLQQCADAVMRLRAEYLLAAGRADEITFNFTSGTRFRYRDWSRGVRAIVRGHRVDLRRTAPPRPMSDRASFRRYLDVVYTYAGSASLEKELRPVRGCRDVRSGDVFIQGGFPGHAVIVLDVAFRKNSTGAALDDRVFLLAQSYMPAQEIHVLVNPQDRQLSPWYRLDESGLLVTPEWEFSTRPDRCSLRRW